MIESTHNRAMQLVSGAMGRSAFPRWGHRSYRHRLLAKSLALIAAIVLPLAACGDDKAHNSAQPRRGGVNIAESLGTSSPSLDNKQAARRGGVEALVEPDAITASAQRYQALIENDVSIRAVKDPVVLEISAGSVQQLVTASSAQRIGLVEQAANEIVWAVDTYPHRVIGIRLRNLAISFDSLPFSDRGWLEERLSQDAARAYESAVATLIGDVLDAVATERRRTSITVFGLPAEPGQISLAAARRTNDHYHNVIEELGRFLSARSFILLSSGMTEGMWAATTMPEALRLGDGRPVIFRTNGMWRMLVYGEEYQDGDRFDDLDAWRLAEGDEATADTVSDVSDEERDERVALLTNDAFDELAIEGDNTTIELADHASGPFFPAIFGGLVHGAGPAGGGGSSGGGGSRSGQAVPPRSPDSDGDGTPDDFDGCPNDPNKVSPGVCGCGTADVDSDGDLVPDCIDGCPDDPDKIDPGRCGCGVPETPGCLWDSWEHLHDFTGLPMTEDGWTDLLALYQDPSLYTNTRIVYVSDSQGNNATGRFYSAGAPQVGADPFNPVGSIQPFKTLLVGYSKLRDGKADMLLLKRGDQWNERFSSGSLGHWRKSGPSTNQRMIFAAYGPAVDRPTLNIGSSTGIAITADNVIVAGVRVYKDDWEANPFSPMWGISMLASRSNILIEDCAIERAKGLRVQGSNDANRMRDVAVRRCVFLEAHGHGGASLYASRTDGLLIEESLFHETTGTNAHNLYLSPASSNPNPGSDDHTLTNLTVRGNIIFNPTGAGIHARAGGVIENNLIMRQAAFVHFGPAGGSEGSVQSGILRNNVLMECKPGTNYGLILKDLDGAQTYGNIITDATGMGGYSIGIQIRRGSNDGSARLMKNVTVRDNIVFNWSAPSDTNRAFQVNVQDVAENIVVQDNDFQMPAGDTELVFHLMSFAPFSYDGNRYHCGSAPNQWFNPGGSLAAWVAASGESGAQAVEVSYPDPERTLRTYHASIGGESTTESFMAEARLQSRMNWRPAYTAGAVNAYIREGFGMPAGGLP